MNHIGAVIVAAGQSKRMGTNKTLLPVGSLSVIQHIVTTLWSTGIAPIAVVTGYQAEKLRDHLACFPVSFVHNPDYAATDMFTSAKLGLNETQPHCERVIFTPADIPLFSRRTVELLTEAEGDIILPVCGGTTGHPILLRASILPKLLQYTGAGGLGGAIRNSHITNRLIPVEDPGILLDADTPADYRKILSYHTSLNAVHGAVCFTETCRSLPDEAACYRIYDRCGTPQAVRNHCRAVRTLAMEMASQLDIALDRELLSAAAMLHDIARTKPDHAAAGAEFLMQEGYCAIARGVCRHHDIESPQILDEAALLFLADKLVAGTKRVSLQERFSASLPKCTTPEALQSHRRQFMQAIQVQLQYTCHIRRKQAQ